MRIHPLQARLLPVRKVRAPLLRGPRPVRDGPREQRPEHARRRAGYRRGGPLPVWRVRGWIGAGVLPEARGRFHGVQVPVLLQGMEI